MAWQHLADTSDLSERDVIGRQHGAQAIAIYKVDGDYYATSDICTHANGRLSEGEIFEGYVECPVHFGLFEIATGKAQGAPVTSDLATYPVRVDGTQILVELPDELDQEKAPRRA
jgi:nitrite reductase/ring-hydroxylating ferredoxin subunit